MWYKQNLANLMISNPLKFKRISMYLEINTCILQPYLQKNEMLWNKSGLKVVTKWSYIIIPTLITCCWPMLSSFVGLLSRTSLNFLPSLWVRINCGRKKHNRNITTDCVNMHMYIKGLYFIFNGKNKKNVQCQF